MQSVVNDIFFSVYQYFGFGLIFAIVSMAVLAWQTSWTLLVVMAVILCIAVALGNYNAKQAYVLWADESQNERVAGYYSNLIFKSVKVGQPQKDYSIYPYFINWMKEYFIQWKRILKPNGSIFMYCSSAMSAKLEIAMSEYFNILSHILFFL